MITLGSHFNLRPHEWCPADHMSAATPSRTPRWRRRVILRETTGGGQLSARLPSKDKARQHLAPDRDKCDLCGRTQVGNSVSQIYGHCANAWLREARRPCRIRTDERHTASTATRVTLGAHHLARLSDEDTLVNASSATASFCYRLSGCLARAQADTAAPRRSGPVAFKDRRVRDPAATTNDPSAAGATTSPRATGHEPMPLLPEAASPQWLRSGFAVTP